jgi:hypothetical protein
VFRSLAATRWTACSIIASPRSDAGKRHRHRRRRFRRRQRSGPARGPTNRVAEQAAAFSLKRGRLTDQATKERAPEDGARSSSFRHSRAKARAYGFTAATGAGLGAEDLPFSIPSILH